MTRKSSNLTPLDFFSFRNITDFPEKNGSQTLARVMRLQNRQQNNGHKIL